MSFQLYQPSERLQPFVKSLAIQNAEEKRSYKVLPNTSIVIGFQYKGRLSYLHGDEEIKLSTAGITGLRDTYRIFQNSPHIGTILVMFTETGASHFFKHPMHELFGGSYSLDQLILSSEISLIEEKLAEAGDDFQRISVIEQFLLSCLGDRENDKRISSAINIIQASKGTIRMSILSEKLNISQSQFEKTFRKVVGASPKKFSSIVRIRSAIDDYPVSDNLTSLAYHSGYFDQAHFIKDFKNFTGQTPEQFFKPSGNSKNS